MSVAGLVLAAGEGKRFGGPKAPYLYDGERLVDRAVRILHEAGCSDVYVVLGAWIDDIAAATVITNGDWITGMGSSLKIGLEYLSEHSAADSVVVTLVDLPGMTAAAIERIVSSDAAIAQAAFGGERGHPVKFAREHWNRVALSAHDDVGARDYLKSVHEEILVIECGDVASGEDLDLRPE
ncbi:MAG: nucleotidyltransferase family protein [Actinomycetes bacterium]